MRRTRIIATLGPATDTPERLGALMDAGVNVFRLNMSHAKHDWVRRVVADIRALARSRQVFPGILMDLQGPSIRTGDVPAPIALRVGDRFHFMVRGAKPPAGELGTTVNYEGLVSDVRAGDTLVVDNGDMKMRVVEVTTAGVACEVLTEGSLGSRRHINLPGVRVSLPALTDKDRGDVVRSGAVGHCRAKGLPQGPRPSAAGRGQDRAPVCRGPLRCDRAGVGRDHGGARRPRD